MIAIEIRQNGELKTTCGVDAFRQLVAFMRVTNTGLEEPICDVEFMGVRPIDEKTEEALRWKKIRIALGDEISFKVVHTNAAQGPFDTQVIEKLTGSEV